MLAFWIYCVGISHLIDIVKKLVELVVLFNQELRMSHVMKLHSVLPNNSDKMKNRYNVKMQWSDVILKELRYECREIIPTKKNNKILAYLVDSHV